MRPDETRESGEGEEEREPFSTGGEAPADAPVQPERSGRPYRSLEILTPHDQDDDLDEDEDEDEDDFDDEDEGVRTVLITGASGNIGRKLRAAWADVYDFVLLDHEAATDERDVIVADLDVLDENWLTHFHGVDTVIHLAANPSEFSTWEELERPNLDALCNVFHACALAGVERLI